MTAEEEVICDGIKRHLDGLNSALIEAHRLGLKVSASCSDALIMYSPQPTQVNIRVWREFVMIRSNAIGRIGA